MFDVKVVLNIICVCHDGPANYQIYLTDNLKSPSCLLGDDEDFGQALSRICRDHLYDDPSILLSTLNLVQVHRNEDRVIIYYSVCLDDSLKIRNGRLVSTDSLNSDILRKIMQGVHHSVRF